MTGPATGGTQGRERPEAPLVVVALDHTGSTQVGDDTVLAVADVWGSAAARRDGRSGPVDVASVASGIRRRLALDGATLLIARDAGEVVVGFALGAPRVGSWELFHLAVDPAAWGRGVADVLLGAVDQHARAEGFDLVELWVIDDNARALAVYERAAYVRTDEVVTDPASGRPERRLVRLLT